MAESTWERRDLPVLEAVRSLELSRAERGLPADAGNDLLVSEALAGQLSELEVRLALEDLYEAGYIHGGTHRTLEGGFEMLAIRLTERGRRAVRQWPSDEAYEAFLEALQRLIDAEPDRARRSKLQALRKHVTDVGKGALGSVIVEAAKHGLM